MSSLTQEKTYDNENPHLSLIAQHKFSTVIGV
jgi:hypothetical protein